MTYTVYACETVTGRNLGPLDIDIQSWTRVLNGSETASFQFNADTAGTGLSAATRDWYRLLTTPARATLVIDWDGLPIWAGPVTSRSRGDTTVAVNCASIDWIFARRKLADPTTTLAGQAYTWTGDYGYIAQQIVAFTLNRSSGSLPIRMPGLSAGSDHTMTYQGRDLNNVSDLLSALTGVTGGPDIDFRPVWTDSNRTAVAWQMLIGSDTAPRLTSSNQLAFDASSPQSGVRTISAADDASNMVMTTWAKGDSVYVDTGGGYYVEQPLVSTASASTYLARGWPLLENETDYTTVAVQAALDAHAAGDLTAYGRPTDQWMITVDALEDPKLGTYQLGDLPTIRFAGDFWIPDGVYPVRIVQVAGNNGSAVQITLTAADSLGLDIIGSPDDSLPARIQRLERAV